MDLYIYYRVPAQHARALQKKITVMQCALRERWPVTTALKRRPELKEGCETWMEIYRQVPEDFQAALTSAVAQAQVEDLTDGQRHLEIFVDMPECV